AIGFYYQHLSLDPLQFASLLHPANAFGHPFEVTRQSGLRTWSGVGQQRLLWVRRQCGGWCPLRRHRRGLPLGGGGGLRRRRWDLRKNFQVSGLEPSHLALHLVLSASEPLNGLQQRVEALRHLLRLLRIDGGDGWRARRDRL